MSVKTWYPALDERNGNYQLLKAEMKAREKYALEMVRIQELRRLQERCRGRVPFPEGRTPTLSYHSVAERPLFQQAGGTPFHRGSASGLSSPALLHQNPQGHGGMSNGNFNRQSAGQNQGMNNQQQGQMNKNQGMNNMQGMNNQQGQMNKNQGMNNQQNQMNKNQGMNNPQNQMNNNQGMNNQQNQGMNKNQGMNNQQNQGMNKNQGMNNQQNQGMNKNQGMNNQQNQGMNKNQGMNNQQNQGMNNQQNQMNKNQGMNNQQNNNQQNQGMNNQQNQMNKNQGGNNQQNQMNKNQGMNNHQSQGNQNKMNYGESQGNFQTSANFGMNNGRRNSTYETSSRCDHGNLDDTKFLTNSKKLTKLTDSRCTCHPNRLSSDMISPALYSEFEKSLEFGGLRSGTPDYQTQRKFRPSTPFSDSPRFRNSSRSVASHYTT